MAETSADLTMSATGAIMDPIASGIPFDQSVESMMSVSVELTELSTLPKAAPIFSASPFIERSAVIT